MANKSIDCRTDGDIRIQFTDTYPMVDAHMHIQSNDIAPITIMRGVMRLKTHLLKFTGKNINYEPELSFLTSNGKAIMPEFLAKLAGAANDAIRMAVSISMGAYSVIGKVGKRSALDDMTAASTTFAKDYGKVARQNSYQIAGLYFSENIGKAMVVPSRMQISNDNDTERAQFGVGERDTLVSERKGSESNFLNATKRYYGKKIEGKPSLYAKFELSVLHTMELMYAHYWGVYGIPLYLSLKNAAGEDELYYIVNGGYLIIGAGMKFFVDNIYDLPEKVLRKYYRITGEAATRKKRIKKAGAIEILKEKYRAMESPGFKFTHFLEKAEDTEIFQFEDFSLHLRHTKMAALKYPFKLLPFYHVDPRRFFAPAEEAIANQHEFYVKDGINALRKVGAQTVVDAIRGSRSAFKYKMSLDDIKKELIFGEMGAGIFWGIKMYAALGCPPCLYKAGENNRDNTSMRIKNMFSALSSGAYSGMKAFYGYCEQYGIPIVCHGSPQGMTIADSSVFLKEYLKNTEGSEYSKDKTANFLVSDRENLIGLGLIDSFSSPDAWEPVLKDFNNLKLCIAHFGGRGFFRGDYGKGSLYDWSDKISGLIKKFTNVYTDISNFTFPKHEEQLNRAVDRLSELLRENHFLKERVLFGTDWPMLETEVKGLEPYKAAMFALLKRLTAKLKETGFKENAGKPWDVWHQWTIINPLRFLGVLKHAKSADGSDCYGVDTAQFEKMFHNIVAQDYQCYDILAKDNPFMKEELGDKKTFRERITWAFYNKYGIARYSTLKIRKAEDITDEHGNLLILED